MPSPKLAARFPSKPPPPSSSSSSSANHYKAPVTKVSSKFLTADTKSKDSTQVTNSNIRMRSFKLAPTVPLLTIRLSCLLLYPDIPLFFHCILFILHY